MGREAFGKLKRQKQSMFTSYGILFSYFKESTKELYLNTKVLLTYFCISNKLHTSSFVSFLGDTDLF